MKVLDVYESLSKQHINVTLNISYSSSENPALSSVAA